MNSIAAHYADTFFLYFGHTLILSHQLAHQTLDIYLPEPHDQVATAYSGVYLDIEEFVGH